jgi:hypothetical protein
LDCPSRDNVVMSDVYRSYPRWSVALYNGATLLHFGLGAAGLAVAYDRWPKLGWALAAAYLAVALGQMYVMMPLVVCPSCVYRTMTAARCVSAMNIVSARLRRIGSPADFALRARSVFCHNNLYLGSLITPIPLIVVALIINFSLAALVLGLAVASLLAFRYFVVFRKMACPHCAAKGRCPNARAMGIV